MSVSKEQATNGIAFINPIYNGFPYARRAVLSFFKYTPEELNPVCISLDDNSPLYAQQDWDYWKTDMPADRHHFEAFPQNGGLTRSWNWGLAKARELGCQYAIAGNSDILFTPGWYEGLMWNLEHGYDLVGPVTNAPGWAQGGKQRQNVRNYFPNYEIGDDPEYLAKVALHLKKTYPIEDVHNWDINGFFSMARVDKWWEGAFDEKHVFNPKYKLTENEVELQRRWKRFGWKMGYVLSSFIYHYRAVSRGDRHKHTGWDRMERKDMHKPV